MGHKMVLYAAVSLAVVGAFDVIAGTCEASLIVSYQFDGDVLDSSGLGNDGTIFGSPAFVPSDLSQAISFDNPLGQQDATQFVSLPNSASILGLSNSSFTFALRYQSTDTQNGRLFGNSGGNPGGTGIAHNYFGGTNNSDSHVIGAIDRVDSPPESDADPIAFVADGLWHWTITVLDRNTSTFSYYVDDHLIVSKPFGSLGSVDFSNILIGANSFDGVNTWFSARLTNVDEFQLYSNPLSATDVDQLVNGNSAVPEPSSLLLLCLGTAGCVALQRRKRTETPSVAP